MSRRSQVEASPHPGLAGRLRALTEAADGCDGRVEPDAVDKARQVVGRAGRRLTLSGEATIVALAGATGSGKSSLFNALSRTDLAATSVRRPTTAHPLACTWGSASAEDLLDWLEVPRRHVLPVGADRSLDGLVLLDLPDHDSTELSHRMEVDRLVELVDSLIWVVDPQKYADAALHERYLRPLAQHAEVMTVVLNHADRLGTADLDRCLRDLRRLLDAEGLGAVDVVAVSAVTGFGIDSLRDRLAQQVREKRSAASRLAADVSVAAERLAVASGTGPARELQRAARDAMTAALCDAAGVPLVTEAVGKAWRLRGSYATGWPVLSWLSKLKPDPLRRLHLGRLGAGRKQRALPAGSGDGATGRTSLPAATSVHQARADAAVRAFADESSTGLARGWADALKVAARTNVARLPDALDRAISTADLDIDRHRRWWAAVRLLQWLLVAGVVVGLLWLGSAFVLAYLQLPPLPDVVWWHLPAPTVLVLGGVLAGLLVAGLARIGVEVGARRRSAQARKALRAAINRVTNELVVEPVAAERERYEGAREAIARARS